MGRPSDNMQPAGKRRPGEQLTKDNADDDSDEGGPGIDPGVWGKADQATMARRKVVKVRRGQAAAAEPVAASASANPFAGVSLTAAAAPSFQPPAGEGAAADEASVKPPGDAAKASQEGAQNTEAAAAPKPSDQPSSDAAASNQQQPAATEPAAGAPSDAKAAPPAEDGKSQAATGSKAEAGAAAAAGSTTPQAAPSNVDKPAEQPEANKTADKAAEPSASAQQPAETTTTVDAATADAAVAAAKPSGALFGGGSTTGGFGGLGSTGNVFGFGAGGFGSLAAGTSGGFGGGGFGGFAAAANKEGASGGSMFGSFTFPPPKAQPGGDQEEAGAGGEAEGEGQEVFGGPDVAPVVTLSEVPKKTGEEQEDAVFTADGALYEFVNGKEWRERGRGELRLNVHRNTHQARLVMRQKGSQRLLLNANLYPKMTTSKMVGGKGVTFSAVNAAPAPSGEGEAQQQEQKGEGDSAAAAAEATAAEAAAGNKASHMKTFAFKVKSPEKIDSFIAIVDNYKAPRSGAAGEAAGQPNPDSWA